MDNLSKLGFLAAELLLKDDVQRFVPREDVAIICFNRSASLDADTAYQATIQHEDAYYPSPAAFVYTLPNIVTGEIAIRNNFMGETAFYICQEFDAEQVCRIVSSTLNDTIRTALVAWVEYFEERCECFMMRVEAHGSAGLPFTVELVNHLYKQLIN
jgi:hypothetical protein